MTSAGAWPPRVWVIIGILATLLLAGLSLVTIGVLRGGFTAGGPGPPVGTCTVPTLSGTVVNINLTNMDGPMMGGGGGPMTGGGPMSGGAMRLQADQATVPHGSVSFLVTSRGSITHEMVVLPLPEPQIVHTPDRRRREARRNGQPRGGLQHLRRRRRPGNSARRLRLGEHHPCAAPVRVAMQSPWPLRRWNVHPAHRHLSRNE